ncbi:MAG: GYF domain-containing protein [Polyangiaceae bacterium]
MSELHEVDCSGCGKRHVLSAEQASKERVVRCDCGQLVRMDRALPDLHSDPAPAPTGEFAHAAPEAVAQQTHLLGSLAAGSGMSGQARATQVSLSGQERSSRPSPSFAPAPFRPSSAPPPSDKPLWYVDLGGAETVEMTIEQLIIARRSGKLGEGALVWRAGMPRWRPVGTLIPASSAGRPTPPPPTPVAPSARLPPPPRVPIPAPSAARRPADGPPASLGSYERPLATLEFALESPVSAAPREPALAPAPPAPRERGASEPPRARTPIPQRMQTPVPPRAPTPVPPRAPTPIPQPARWTSPTSVVAPLPAPPAAVSSAPVTLPPPNSGPAELLGERPPWRTISLALLLCIGASGSGAFLVRTLRVHRQPLILAPNSAPTVAASALAGATVAASSNVRAASATEPVPLVVELSSLSVEHTPPRAPARPAVVAPVKASEPSDDNNDSAPTDPAPALPATAQKPKNADLPAAARANPYTTGTLDDSNAKKAPAAQGDEPSL